MTSLRKCDGWWGEVTISAEAPRIRVVEDAIYLPFRRNQAWGIFDAERRIVPEAVDVRGPERIPSAQELDWPTGLPAPNETSPDPELLYLGRAHTHYGHVIIDTLARFWPLLEGAGGPPLLCHGPARTDLWRTQRPLPEALAAFGHRAEDVRAYDRPLRIRRLLVPEPAFVAQLRAHPVFAAVCRHVGRAQPRRSAGALDDRPVYLSKARLAGGVGRFAQEPEITRILSENGVDIAYPEKLTFAGQVDLMAERRLLVGTTSSAFHTTIFCGEGRSLIGLSAIAQPNANFGLIDRLAGNEATYWHPEDVTYAKGEGFHTEASVPSGARIAHDLLALIRAHPAFRSASTSRWNWWRRRPRPGGS